MHDFKIFDDSFWSSLVRMIVGVAGIGIGIGIGVGWLIWG